MTDTFKLKAFQAGLILPDIPGYFLDLWYYQEEMEFISVELEKRRQMCMDLFRVGCNVLPEDKYYPTNLSYAETLKEEFPLMRFETPADFKTFVHTPTFYLTESLTSHEGDDILGNEYHQLPVVLMKICPGKALGQYELYSLEELIETFIYYGEFVDPKWSFGKDQRFTQVQIARLKKLCEKCKAYSSEAALLLKIMQLMTSAQQQQLNRIQRFAQQATPKYKQILIDILKVAMYMRGWNGKSKYPLRAEDTHEAVNENKLLNKLWQLYQTDDCVLELPLWCQLNAMEEFMDVLPANHLHMSVDPAHGVSIKDKLRIILENQDGYACIRLSSNWLAATAWYYLNKFYNWQPFDITHLERIQ